MKNLHSIQYYEKRLYKLQNAADAIGYDIDENKAYKAACKALPVPGYDDTSIIPDAFFRAYSAACEAVETARREATR